MFDDALHEIRGTAGRAPDVFTRGGWVPMREYPNDEEVDFAIVGTGSAGGTLACRLAEMGFKVVAFDAEAWWRPLEEFASDEAHQEKLFWTGERICDGDNPLKLGNNNSGKAVGGSTVHFAMVSLRFRPKWFKSRTLLGYGADWPLDWRKMWRYYAQAEDALKISGPVNYPWGPKRPRYPYRAHELNAAAMVLARGAEALGAGWSATLLATLSAPRGHAHPCVYRGFCVSGSRPTRNKARWSRGFRARWKLGLKCATSRWSAASSPTRLGSRPASNICAKTLPVPAREERGGRGLRDRNAAPPADVGEQPLSRRAREQFRAGRQEPDGAIEPGHLRQLRRRDPLVQGAAFARHHGTLELHR
jgi:hypothetical protein